MQYHYICSMNVSRAGVVTSAEKKAKSDVKRDGAMASITHSTPGKHEEETSGSSDLFGKG